MAQSWHKTQLPAYRLLRLIGKATPEYKKPHHRLNINHGESKMKKKFIGWLTGSVAVMFLLPWAAITFIPSDAGMAGILLLFFAIYPVYAIILGFFAGKNIKGMWSLPFITAALFLLGSWLFFDPGEGAFVIYTGVYWVMSMITMFLSSRLRA